MTWTKTKTAAVAGAVILLAAGIGFVAVKTIQAVRSANAPDIQGPWAGIFEIKEANAKSPVLYKITRENGSYHAVGVSPYRGAMEVPMDKLIYHFPSVHIERTAIGFTYDATLNPKTMEISGTWKAGKISGPLTLKLNALPDAFPEPLAESDYAPRKDSDAQGYWQGTLKAGNTPLRMALKIAERTNGVFRAVLNSLDQGGLDIEATERHLPGTNVEGRIRRDWRRIRRHGGLQRPGHDRQLDAGRHTVATDPGTCQCSSRGGERRGHRGAKGLLPHRPERFAGALARNLGGQTSRRETSSGLEHRQAAGRQIFLLDGQH